jgi:hypothetical protein
LTNKATHLKGKQPLFYTQIEHSTVSGYIIDHENLIGKKSWSVNLGQNEKIINIETQYNTQSLASEPAGIAPTSFGVEGVLLYKYLDSNMFAITSQNTEDLSTYTIMFVNGVTGSLIHQ